MMRRPRPAGNGADGQAHGPPPTALPGPASEPAVEARPLRSADNDGWELRKLQVTGGSSLAITLPKPWIGRSGLKAGDAVGCVVRPDGTLLVTPRPDRRREARSLRLDAGEEGPEGLFRRLVGAYLNGVDVLQVGSRGPMRPEQRASVREAVRRAMGLEVVDEAASSVTIQNFLDPTEFPLEKGLRRMSALARQMHADAVAPLGAVIGPSDRTMDERDGEVDRLFWLVNRQYHTLLRDARLADDIGATPSEALHFLLVARLVERTADHAVRIAENLAELEGTRLDGGLAGELRAFDERCLEVFRDGLASFFERDAAKANRAIDAAHALAPMRRELVHRVMELRGPPAVALAYVVESAERSAMYGGDAGEIALQHIVAREMKG